MYTIPGPVKYVREAGLLEEVGSYIKEFGDSALFIGGKTALSVVEMQVKKSLDAYKIENKGFEWYGGECSWTQVERLSQIVQDKKPQVIVAVGGGKAIDTVKAVAFAEKLPVLAIPTIAATCAAATPIAIMYDDEGTFTEISHRSKAPSLVLVDSDVIAKASYRFLVAGIGDTLAKWFESSASVKKSQPTALNRSAVKLANELYHLLLEKGPSAIETIKQGKVDQSVNDVIDSIILISGSVSGYGGDDCRTAAAHAIYSGLTIFPEVHDTYHGEIVAFGILSQLVLEGKSEEEIRELIAFYQKVELPYTLEDMAIKDLSADDWKRLGDVTVDIEDMANMPFAVTPDMVIHAVQGADQIGRKVKQQ
ncbi:iron-containing alcohol dehydrogenase family protein [Brevibacillus invocatus]|uniref:iron-containing alcohol dehydrogenase family protein n=1 Tax=Brevibacillus invocatus TaxID=173959 RepID=UPI00203DB0E5|nr:iron-containing alcohol dehydrogenase family protein [Brevibacillus invocatus]MCM3077716.1 iron-containing alcohol dehydrogenase family protein [Brevibacillus invocatus]MCM3428717.1 iron-containing alcohol dehydrogenase family protein [Brevibacillus invocatus]